MKTDIMGLKIDNITMDEAVTRSKAALTGECVPIAVFTPNAEIAYACSKDESLMKTVNSAELVLPDGAGVVKAAKILDLPINEKVAGIEYGERLCAICADCGAGLYILGGKPGIAVQAAEKLTAEYSGLNVCGTHDGYFDKNII